MARIRDDFISTDNRVYKFKIGQVIASSLSGFIAGFITATVIWVVIFKFLP